MYSFNACYDDFTLKFRCCSPVCSMNYCSCLHHRLPRTRFLQINFSLAMGKPIIHLTCFAGPTVIAFPKFSVFYETRKTSWHSSHCLFEFIFIGLSRVTIVLFFLLPTNSKGYSLQYRPWALQHYTRVSCVEIHHIARKFHEKTLVKHSCKNIHAKIHEKIHAN